MKLVDLDPNSVMEAISQIELRGHHDCWPYTGKGSEGRYGHMAVHVKLASGGWVTVNIHRLAYLYRWGEIPEGFSILHRCDNGICCNHNHLWLGTHKDNTADMMVKGRKARAGMLTDLQVAAIRVDGRTHKEIAGEYGISRQQVGKIKANQRWKG